MTPPKRRTIGGSTQRSVTSATTRTAPMIAPPPTALPPSASRRISAWAVAALGLVVFFVGWIGAQTGAIAVPGDRHHVFSQFVGVGLIGLGVRIGSGPKSRRDAQR